MLGWYKKSHLIKQSNTHTHLHFSLVIVYGALTTMTRGQGLNSRFSTMVRHLGRLGTVIQTVFSFGGFLFYGKCVLADQSPPSSRVDFFSASSSCGDESPDSSRMGVILRWIFFSPI